MKSCFIFPLIALKLILVLAMPVAAQKFSFDRNTSKGSVRFKLVHNLVIVPVYMNDNGPYNFILDSGVGPIIVTDEGIIDSLQKSNLPLYKLRGRGVGDEIEAYIINDLSLKIDRASSEKSYGVLIKNDPLQLSSYLGLPIHGIIGSDFFKSFIVKINYSSQRLSFYDFSSMIKKKGAVFKIAFIKDKPYIPVVVVEQDGEQDSLLLLVDSGAGHAVSIDLKEGDSTFIPENTISASLGVGLNGPIQGLLGRLKEVRIGELVFKNVISSFPMYEDKELQLLMTEQAGSIGGEILKRFTVIFDYGRGEIYLKKNRYFKSAFEHDMSGLELYVVNDYQQRFFVGRVDIYSPADDAGFLPGDEILSINFKSIKSYSLERVNRLLQANSSSLVIFEIAREGKIIFKMIKLKRRI